MKHLTYFQASQQTDEEAIHQFVVREVELNTVLSVVKEDDMSSSIQHFILVGQRGSGKSTLLRRLQATVRIDEELSSRLVPVNLSEEQAGIYRLHDLWDRVAQELREQGMPVNEVDWERLESSGIGACELQSHTKCSKELKKKAVITS